jgi:aspartate 1-decarboxylase
LYGVATTKYLADVLASALRRRLIVGRADSVSSPTRSVDHSVSKYHEVTDSTKFAGVTAQAACTERTNMHRRMMKSKIHRATVTGADLHYVGSISIDTELLELADIRVNEQVAVIDIDNGERFETYALPGNPGEICLNGAAARLVVPGDRVIILSYADYEDSELEAYHPTFVHVDATNNPIDPSIVPLGRLYVDI